jgi:hypothetical protein
MNTKPNTPASRNEEAVARERFEKAMVEAGYDKPELGSGGGYLYQRDEDRFVGFALAAPRAAIDAREQELIDWVVARWHAEVANRPLVNVHRRSLDDTWRQMLRHLGVDDRARLGPTHDELLSTSKEVSQ